MKIAVIEFCGFAHTLMTLLKTFFIFCTLKHLFIYVPGIHKCLSSKKNSSQCLLLADMAVQNFVGDAFRGATWVALHNGGGVGW